MKLTKLGLLALLILSSSTSLFASEMCFITLDTAIFTEFDRSINNYWHVDSIQYAIRKTCDGRTVIENHGLKKKPSRIEGGEDSNGLESSFVSSKILAEQSNQEILSGYLAPLIKDGLRLLAPCENDKPTYLNERGYPMIESQLNLVTKCQLSR